MAWIDTINERDADGSLKDQYAKLKDSRSGVDNPENSQPEPGITGCPCSTV